MIIPHRVHNYMRSGSPYLKNSNNKTEVRILNALISDEFVSLGAQWPAAGLVSSVPDFLEFGNYLLNSYKGVNDSKAGTRSKFR
jgi:hypothetical protein